MKTVLEVLTLSTDYLKKKGIEHPRRQAEELIGEALGVGRMGVYLQFDRPLSDEELVLCREWLKRRSEGEPIQYIAGKVDFFDCVITVSPDVLIPRQETEILVSKIVNELEKRELSCKVLWDVCCGSGCLGIALKKRFPDLTVVLSDLSPKALAVARQNAQNNGVDVEFLQGDLLEPFQGRQTDYLVCNPPYVTEGEWHGLDREVKDHEPRMALVSGPAGTECYEKIAPLLSRHIRSGGRAWFEIGAGQGGRLSDIFVAAGLTSSKVEFDWSGKERFFSLEIE